ncbi:DUF5839 family protein [Lysinibacillus sp. fkY74-1]|uniref:DUF5839 family protein n=1 Tax=Lysinibacillus TaxID=400634 RepID=UPI001FAFCC28|nr:DUF5839 family protein [Lysinibacillus sphaericus]MEB7454729.1 DUF5839 family protein [Lysinibacillus sphaericus]
MGFKAFVGVIYESLKKIKAEDKLGLSHGYLETIKYHSLDAAISASDQYVKINPKKYTWHIPKYLLDLNIQPGDIVNVGKPIARILVTEVFREEIEETGKQYKRIRGLLEKVSQKV